MTFKTILYLSLICASISFTVAESKLFEPLREWTKKRNRFFGELITCGYCFGHWTAFFLVAVLAVAVDSPSGLLGFPPGVWRIVDYFFTALAIAWLSGFQWIAFCFIIDKAGK